MITYQKYPQPKLASIQVMEREETSDHIGLSDSKEIDFKVIYILLDGSVPTFQITSGILNI